jgi:uncharacterized protein DUF1207
MLRVRAVLFGFIRRLRRFSLIGMLLLSPTLAYPADEAAGPAAVMFLPPGDLYPPYVADLQRVGFGVQWQSYTKTAIPDSGIHRVALKAGGQFGIVRAGTSGADGREWQADVLGGFNAQFDADHSLDNIGWDGRYGLLVTTGKPRGIAFRFGVLHDSSHVGDEYMIRTGRTRIGYTRQELAAGVSLPLDERWRTYAEGGWGYQFGNDQLMKPGRGQAGLEYESCRGLGESCPGWYGAVDLSATEERNWRLDVAAQVGLATRSGGRTWRIGIEWYQGRPPIGEFFQYTERSISLGLWLDV